jgi:hypothetical protein
MSIRQSTNLNLYLEVMNVMYFEHDESIYVDDCDDNSIQIHGVKPDDMANLMRNLICCRDSKIKLDEVNSNSVRSLRELKLKLNEMFDVYDGKSTMKGE